MADDLENLYKEILQRFLSRMVSEKLGLIYRDVGDMIKQLSKDEIEVAETIILEMAETACREYFGKMRGRIQKRN